MVATPLSAVSSRSEPDVTICDARIDRMVGSSTAPDDNYELCLRTINSDVATLL